MDFAFRESTLVRSLYNPDYTAWPHTWSGTVPSFCSRSSNLQEE